MTKARTEYIYHFTGHLTQIKPKKASAKSKYAGSVYYDLMVNLTKPHQHIKTIQLFAEKLTNPNSWEAILQKELPAKYRFACRNIRGYYYLVDWNELPETRKEVVSK